jgi:hypothetical protein
MALFKSDELLELSRRQSAAKPQTLLWKVQRLGGFSSVRCNTPLASDTRKSDDIVLAPGDSGISRMLTTSPWILPLLNPLLWHSQHHPLVDTIVKL